MVYEDDSDYCVFGASKSVSKRSIDNYCRGGPVLREFVKALKSKEFKGATEKWLSNLKSHQGKSKSKKRFKI